MLFLLATRIHCNLIFITNCEKQPSLVQAFARYAYLDSVCLLASKTTGIH